MFPTCASTINRESGKYAHIKEPNLRGMTPHLRSVTIRYACTPASMQVHSANPAEATRHSNPGVLTGSPNVAASGNGRRLRKATPKVCSKINSVAFKSFMRHLLLGD